MKTICDRNLVSCLLTLPLLMVSITVMAEDLNRAAAANPKVAEDAAVSQAALAIQLALLGEQRKSPLMLLSAAELMGELTQSPRETTEIKVEQKPSDSDKTAPDISYKALLSRAEELAKDNKELSDLVAARVTQLRGSRGLVGSQGNDKPSVVIGGVTYKILDTDVLGANRYVTYTNIRFEGKLPAVVAVVGDGDGDLDVYVYDGNNGGLIGSDTQGDSTPVVTWTPLYEGPFTIKVENVGQIAEKYSVLANW